MATRLLSYCLVTMVMAIQDGTPRRGYQLRRAEFPGAWMSCVVGGTHGGWYSVRYFSYR